MAGRLNIMLCKQVFSATLLFTAAFNSFVSLAVAGDFKVRSPNIDYREVEFETNTATTFDKRPENKGRAGLTQEIGVGVLPFWFVELEAELGREPGEKWQFNATTIENTFMLTEQGKYWMDFGIFAEFSHARNFNNADTVKVGGLFLKRAYEVCKHVQCVSRKGSWPQCRYSGQPVVCVANTLSVRPVVPSRVSKSMAKSTTSSSAGKFDDRYLRLGPVVTGQYNLGEIGGRGKLKYEVGYLVGVTTPTERGTLRTRLELEIPF